MCVCVMYVYVRIYICIYIYIYYIYKRVCESEGPRTAYFLPGRVGEVSQEATESTPCVCLFVCLSARAGRGRGWPRPTHLGFPLSCSPPVATHPRPTQLTAATHPLRHTRRDPFAVSHPARPTCRHSPATPSLLSAKAAC